MKRFNVTGNCVPEEDYMVDIGGKIAEIKKLVEGKYYFTINRARQYGKTTTLAMLERAIKDEYAVASISFQGLGDTSFATEENFCRSFMGLICEAMQSYKTNRAYGRKWMDKKVKTFMQLDRHISKMCKGKKVVLMVDEVDKASNNRVFLDFLGMLREKYIARRNGKDYTFHSVILAGVHDIKNMKVKMMSEGTHTPSATENKIYNSPWNIAADFVVDMAFGPSEIAAMLGDYETDHKTGMDIAAVAGEIHAYTGGYPFLVSRICQHIDEKLGQNWTAGGIRKAVDILLAEHNTLFDDMFKNLENNADLYTLIYDMLIVGEKRTFNIDNPVLGTASMYGIIKNGNPYVGIANRIFEMRICEYFISKEETNPAKKTNGNGVLKHDVVKDGRFDMELCLRKFAEHYEEIYSEDDMKFLERHGRLLFLSYLKPLINGGGFYHIESQFTDLRRMDIVVDYGREQFIIELKLWRGEQHEREAYEQLLGYMDSKRADTGYLLTFDFRKGAKKQPKAEWVEFGGKRIFDVIV